MTASADIEARESRIDTYHLELMQARGLTQKAVIDSLSEGEQADWKKVADARLWYVRPLRRNFQKVEGVYLRQLDSYIKTWVEPYDKAKAGSPGTRSLLRRIYLRWFDFGSFQLPCPWLTRE